MTTRLHDSPKMYNPAMFSHRSKKTIGILGGSFNPAHDGHAHIADMAVRALELDELWWLVSPQNPLKPTDGMAPFADRYSSALTIAAGCIYARRMKVTSVEARLRSSLTYQTTTLLRQRIHGARLVWVMGGDSMASFHHWQRPEIISRNMAIAVVNRPGARHVRGSKGAKIAGRHISPRMMNARHYPPKHWTYIQGKMNAQSATKIRAKLTGQLTG